jgi:DNA-binding NtrC family response regulator
MNQHPDLVAASLPMRELLGAALDVAPTPTTVLITGESGTGKELLARFIHAASPRAALPFTLVPSVTFEADALAGALQHGGTVVIDELGALGLEAQAKLLALLEQPHLSRLLATSNRPLAGLVDRGTLRSDLFYRIDVYPLHVPALRERREDIAQLADKLLTRIAAGLVRTPLRLTGAALASLESYDWPGNVRELANVLERSAIRARGPLLDTVDLPIDPQRNSPSPFPDQLPLDLEQLERLAIGEALRRTGGNRTHAARLLNIGLRTLRQKLNGPSRASVMDEAPERPGDVP